MKNKGNLALPVLLITSFILAAGLIVTSRIDQNQQNRPQAQQSPATADLSCQTNQFCIAPPPNVVEPQCPQHDINQTYQYPLNCPAGVQSFEIFGHDHDRDVRFDLLGYDDSNQEVLSYKQDSNTSISVDTNSSFKDRCETLEDHSEFDSDCYDLAFPEGNRQLPSNICDLQVTKLALRPFLPGDRGDHAHLCLRNVVCCPQPTNTPIPTPTNTPIPPTPTPTSIPTSTPPTPTPTSCHAPLCLALVLDDSGSIGEKFDSDIVPAAKAVINYPRLELDQPGSRSLASLVIFAARVLRKVDLTNNKQTLINDLVGSNISETCIDCALREAQSQLANCPAGNTPVIMLMTDGWNGTNQDPVQIANEIKQQNILIVGVGVGEVNESEMNMISSDGYFAKSSGWHDLEATFVKMMDKICNQGRLDRSCVFQRNNYSSSILLGDVIKTSWQEVISFTAETSGYVNLTSLPVLNGSGSLECKITDNANQNLSSIVKQEITAPAGIRWHNLYWGASPRVIAGQQYKILCRSDNNSSSPRWVEFGVWRNSHRVREIGYRLQICPHQVSPPRPFMGNSPGNITPPPEDGNSSPIVSSPPAQTEPSVSGFLRYLWQSIKSVF